MGTTLFGRIEIFLMGGADQLGRRMRRTKRHDVVDEFERQYLSHVCGRSLCIWMKYADRFYNQSRAAAHTLIFAPLS